MLRSFPHYQQLDSMDCGPSCLRMIAKFYGRVYSIQNLREKVFVQKQDFQVMFLCKKTLIVQRSL